MRKKIIIVLSLIVIILLVMIFAIRILSVEDSWICDPTGWVKHGNPQEPIPTTKCGEKTTSPLDSVSTNSSEFQD